MSAAPQINVEYDAIEAVNWSTIVHLATSPKLMRWRVEHPRRETPALVLGTAIHCAVLEPERWPTAYRRAPFFGDLRTKAGKQARAEWLASLHDDTTVLSAEDYDTAERCADAVRSHPVAANLLRGGRAEEIVTWTDAETGLACKSRLDFITAQIVIDLKSTRLTTLGAIAREFASRLYYGQLAMYHDGAIASRRIYGDETPRSIVVQTVEPYDVVPLRLTRDDLERGRGLYRSLLRKYVECQAAGWWPGLAPTLIDLDLPAWAPGGDDENEGDEW